MIGLYFAASWCPACRSTTPLLASTYNALRHRGKGLQILLVSQDASESDFDVYRRAMPWPALPHGGAYPALLAEVFHVGAMPCLVLPCASRNVPWTSLGMRVLTMAPSHALDKPWHASAHHGALASPQVLLSSDGFVISTDGVRLMRKHARSFPWSSVKPPETAHHHPLLERLLRREPVDAGTAHGLPRYSPIDMLQQPAIVRTLDEAVNALRHCDRLCTLIAVQVRLVDCV